MSTDLPPAKALVGVLRKFVPASWTDSVSADSVHRNLTAPAKLESTERIECAPEKEDDMQ